MSRSDNPLAKYFREPGPYVKLPTQGYFYDPGMIDFTGTGEVAVYPMTAYDELVLKNPDALLNGDAVERVLASCTPGLHDPRGLCSCDADVLLLAARLASYGDELQIEVKCPECRADGSYGISIRYLLETITLHEADYPVTGSKGVVFHLRPQLYGAATRAAIATFEQVSIIKALQTAEMEQSEKARIYDEAFTKLCSTNIDVLADQIQSVDTPEGTVVDREFIREFLHNIDTKTAEKVQERTKELAKIGLRKEVDVECPECQHRWQAQMAYDPSHFFG